MEFNLETAFRECALSDLVSFDVFDTALLRKVGRPVDVFRMMEFKAGKIMDRKLPSFFQCRLDSETMARSKAASQGRQITLGNVYEELRLVCNMTSTQTEALQQCEIEMEKTVSYAHPLILRLYRHVLGL